MTHQTKIEWTDYTVNFWEGCQKVGPGCDHCYAEERNGRFSRGENWGPSAPRRKVKGGPAKLRKIQREAKGFHAEHGRWPRVFLSSLCDVFDNAVSPDWRMDLFRAIEAAPNVRVQMLTKRISNVFKMVPAAWATSTGWPSHVGLMITVVNQDEADRDIPKLLELKARLSIPWVGLSVEPMIGPIDLTNINDDEGWVEFEWLDWVICGGESGSKARPMHPDWARTLRDQCEAADTAFLFKQWGEWADTETMGIDGDAQLRALFKIKSGDADKTHTFDDNVQMYRLGKKDAGRLLGGIEHNGFPEALIAQEEGK